MSFSFSIFGLVTITIQLIDIDWSDRDVAIGIKIAW